MPTKTNSDTFNFRARIQAGERGGAFVFFPHDVEKAFGTKGRVAVKATIDGVAYRGSLVKYGSPQHLLGVLKEIRAAIGKGPGDRVDVVLRRDETPREIDVPPEFQKRMKQERVLAAFEKLSYTHQKEYCRWIAEAKKDQTRQSRLNKAIDMLRAGVKTPDAPKT